MKLNTFKITFKKTRRSRKTISYQQFHDNCGDAATIGMRIIRESYPDAHMVSVEESTVEA